MPVAAIHDDVVEQDLAPGIEHALGGQLLEGPHVHAVNESRVPRFALESLLRGALLLPAADLPQAEADQQRDQHGAERISQPAFRFLSGCHHVILLDPAPLGIQ